MIWEIFNNKVEEHFSSEGMKEIELEFCVLKKENMNIAKYNIAFI